MMRYLVLAGVLLLAFSAPSYAEDNSVPPQLQGRWDFPSCQYGELYTTFSKHFAMRADRSTAALEHIIKYGRKKDYYVAQDNRKSYIMRPNAELTKFDLIYLGTGTSADEDKFIASPLNTKSDDVVSLGYARCPQQELQDWPPTQGTKLEVLPLLDAAMDACGDKIIMGNMPCQQAIFGGLDLDHNGGLDYHELMAAYPRLAFIVAANSCNFQLAYNPGRISRSAVLFASETLSYLDQDKSGALSFEEASQLTRLTPGSFSYGFLQELKTLYEILPFLPESAQHYTCTSCSSDALSQVDPPVNGACTTCSAAARQP